MSTSPDPQSVVEAELPAAGEMSGAEAGGTATVQAKARTRTKRGGRAGAAHSHPAPPPAGAYNHLLEDDKEGFFQRFGAGLIIGVIVLGGGAYLFFKKPAPPSAPARLERIVMIAPLPALPPPPPPPPPPPQQKPPEEKMEKETAAAEEAKPDPKPEPAKAPADPALLGTGLKGDGPGLAGLGGGSGIGGGTLSGSGGSNGGSRFGWYAGQVQSKIAEALRKHPTTKSAGMRVEVRIWPDSTGRITRAQLAGSSGDAALDDAIKNGVLTGLQLQEPPPAGMKLPIVLRLTAQRQSR